MLNPSLTHRFTRLLNVKCSHVVFSELSRWRHYYFKSLSTVAPPMPSWGVTLQASCETMPSLFFHHLDLRETENSCDKNTHLHFCSGNYKSLTSLNLYSMQQRSNQRRKGGEGGTIREQRHCYRSPTDPVWNTGVKACSSPLNLISHGQ